MPTVRVNPRRRAGRNACSRTAFRFGQRGSTPEGEGDGPQPALTPQDEETSTPMWRDPRYNRRALNRGDRRDQGRESGRRERDLRGESAPLKWLELQRRW